jgi:DNA-binding Lrp family transcriptional regulator
LVEAYVLIKITAQKEHHGFARTVVEKLRGIEGVKTAELLFGDYDAIINMKVPKIHDCENLILEEISMIDGVENTTTLLCIDEGILE